MHVLFFPKRTLDEMIVQSSHSQHWGNNYKSRVLSTYLQSKQGTSKGYY